MKKGILAGILIAAFGLAGIVHAADAKKPAKPAAKAVKKEAVAAKPEAKTTETSETKTTETKTTAASGEFKSVEDRISYIIGHQIGSDFKKNGTTLNPAILSRALQDAQAGKPMVMSEEEIQKTYDEFKAAAQQKAEQQAAKNAEEGKKFLAENAKKPGWKTTPSGLQYKVVKDGNGPMPKATDGVEVFYKGTFINGEVFDETKGGKPATFEVGRVVPGWTEALKMMKVGSKWELAIPSELGYGAQGRQGMPGNSVLLFEVELVKIAPPTPPTGPGGPGGPGLQMMPPEPPAGK